MFKIIYWQDYYTGQNMCPDLHNADLQTEEEVLEWLEQTAADVKAPKLQRGEDYCTRRVERIYEYGIRRSGLQDVFKVDPERVEQIVKERQHDKDLKDLLEIEEEAKRIKETELNLYTELKEKYER